MNKLWVRLTGAFLVVALVAVGAVAMIVNRTTANSFRSYVGQQTTANANAELIRSLETFYTNTGSWTGAQDILANARSGRGSGQGHGGGGGEGPLFLLLGTDYTILAASDPQQIGRSVSAAERNQALALMVEGQTIGYLLREGAGAQALDTAQYKFLDDVSNVLALTAVGAMMLALVMGLAFSWVLVRPLSHLRQSAAAITHGSLGAQMPIGGTTEFREVATAFNRMSAALAESEAVRQRMTSDIAHELRSPISVMRGQLEAMMDGVFPLNTEQLVVVYDQTLHLGRLIEELRTLTRAESGRLPLEMTWVNPNEFVQRVVADFAPLAQEESIVLSADIAPELPAIRSDVDRLRQIFANLLANALAHTPSGGSITVKAIRFETGVRFAVVDNGPGLTPKQAAHVFERFYRADDARRRDQGGSGLGLAITQELVKLHNGRIWVESTPGKGSAFCFEIPVTFPKE